MLEKLLTVKYITSKSCFCSISLNNFKQLQENAIKVVYNQNQQAVFSIDVSIRLHDDDFIGISSFYAKLLGIKEKSIVSVSEIPKPPTIQSLTVVANSNDDHNVLELLAETVQSTLLQQVRVLKNHQKIVIWIGSSIHVTVNVFDITPISPGRIDNFTEVVIKPPSFENSNQKLNIFDKYSNCEQDLILRAIPCSDLQFPIDFVHPFNIFISKNDLKKENTTVDPLIYKIRLLRPSDNEKDLEKAVFVRVYALEEVLEVTPEFYTKNNIFLSEAILEYFSCGLGAWFSARKHEDPPLNVQEIEFSAKRNVEELIRDYIKGKSGQKVLVFSENVQFYVKSGVKVSLSFTPIKAAFCCIDCASFELNFVFKQANYDPASISGPERLQVDNFVTNVGNYKAIIDECLFLFMKNTGGCSSVNNAVITGKAGSGKSTLLKLVKHYLSASPSFIYTKMVNCKCLKGKTLESLHKYFTLLFFELIYHQPSVLILDDLHILCENVDEGDALAQNALYFNRVSEMLENVFRIFCEHNEIGVLASTRSVLHLNKQIYATRGNHLLRNVCQIGDLSKNDRKKALEFLFAAYEVDADLNELAEKSECFAMQDLADFANKALFESYQNDSSEKVSKITRDDWETALKNTTVTSLEGVRLQASNGKRLDEIGGLDAVKQQLVEIMLWPAKHPKLFENAPLRLPSGLLLYGPPGTGKTILAGAAASHCGLRLISIKGPELLSKYIGASEQAVRDVFQRAQSARPCVLFFDEFDSLAPRRGHDTTGVTDRVVNQLLTQLDGVESLSGVFVLAATSRPDLLDPALLRPGRLDHHISCTLPNTVERLGILAALSKNLSFALDVNLAEIADGSVGFSGADLQALLYTAQLDSVRNLIADEANNDAFGTEIRQDQLVEALRKTRPSLSRAEKAKYEKIYRGFEGGSVEGGVPGSRATLA